MKMKVYLIVSIIIQVILAGYSIVTVDAVVQSQIMELQETVKILPEMEQELMALAMTPKEVVIVSVINIVLNILASVIVLKNDMVKRKGSLIAIYVACLLTTPDALVSWITVINIIVLSCIKRKDKSEKKKFSIKEAEKSLKVEQDRTDKKGIFLIIAFVAVYLLQLIPGSVLPDSKIFIIIFVATIYLTLFVLAIIIFWRDIKQGIKLIKNNFKTFLKYILRVLATTFVFYLMANLIAVFTTDKITSVNQETLEMIPIVFVAPIAIIWAPIVEEALFRGVIRKIIKNDTVFIIISSAIFGLMHVVGEASLGIAIATAIPYAILGGGFAYIYAKTNNLTCNMITHSVYNTIGVLLMLLG